MPSSDLFVVQVPVLGVLKNECVTYKVGINYAPIINTIIFQKIYLVQKMVK